MQVAAAGDNIGFRQMRRDLGNALGLVLSVAIKRDQSVVAAIDRRLKSRAQTRTVAQVVRMANRPDRGELS